MRNLSESATKPSRVALIAAFLFACGGDDTNGNDGAVGPAGAPGAPGAVGEPGSGASSSGALAASLNGVSPTSIAAGKTSTVVVSAIGTQWTTPPTVSIDGTGVDVTNVTVASPTALLLSVQAAPDAQPGARTLSVDSGADRLTFTGLEVASNLSYSVVGELAALGIAYVTVVGADSENPFGPYLRLEISKNGTPLATGQDLVLNQLPVADLGPNRLFFTFSADAQAAGSYDLDLVTGNSSALLGEHHHYGPGFSVAARQPEVVVSPHQWVIPSTAALTSKPFRHDTLTAASGGRVTCTATPAAPPSGYAAVPRMAGATGQVTDGSTFWKQGEPVIGALTVLSIGTGPQVDVVNRLDCNLVAAAILDEAEPNDTTASALALPGSGAIRGSIAAGERDFVSFTTTATHRARIAKRGPGTLTMRVYQGTSTLVDTRVLSATQASATTADIVFGAGTSYVEIFADADQIGAPYELSVD